MHRVFSAETWPEHEVIEADSIVAGTGAGGAVVAWELAQRGHAVALFEVGNLLRRHDVRRSALQSSRSCYRGGLAAMGSAVIPVLVGKLVGASTAVNTGTCWHPPDRILRSWCEQVECDDFLPENMRFYLERVDRRLEVALSPPETIGPIGAIIGRGCDRLGWTHEPSPRNAPGCRGEGFCLFGCATDARRGTNLAYVPSALERSALLVTGARVDTKQGGPGVADA